MTKDEFFQRTFAEVCKNTETVVISELYEYLLNDRARAAIMQACEPEAEEPIRSAFNNLGKKYHVDSLIDY